MAYKVLTRLNENDSWDAVIDMKLSKTRKVERLFYTEADAEHFINNHLKTIERSNIKVEEAENYDEASA